MLLFHAAAVLAVAALAERGVIHARIGIGSAFGFVIAAALFAGDLTLRHYAGHSLFPMAAPSGGALLIVTGSRSRWRRHGQRGWEHLPWPPIRQKPPHRGGTRPAS
jgi:hypothetical protein